MPEGFWATVAAVTGVGRPTREESLLMWTGLLWRAMGSGKLLERFPNAFEGADDGITELRGEGVGRVTTGPRRGS
ncbi:hypothetical protein GCM10023079_51620 [Streptomyces chitinivorans]